MTRPATPADMRAEAWRQLRALRGRPHYWTEAAFALRWLAVLDQAEAGDAHAAAQIAERLAGFVVEPAADGALAWFAVEGEGVTR